MSCNSSIDDDNGFKEHLIDSISTAAVETRKPLAILISKLYDICLEGDLPSLLNLFQEDPHILDRSTNETQTTPLHIAASSGNLEIVKALLKVKPNICFIRDRDGRNPVHAAAIEGHIEVVQLFYQENSYAAKERTNDGETILHLCVKHKHMNAQEKFLELTKDVELLNSKDNNGNTILHLAVIGKQIEMVKLISKQPRIAKNAVNNNGLTALDHHLRSVPRTKKKLNWSKSVSIEDEIWVSLTKVKALRAKDVLLKIRDKAWVENQSQSLMIVASLIATIAFQIILSPPRGFWQDGKIPGPNDNTNNIDRVAKFFSFHDAGAPIARDLIPVLYRQLMVWNTIALSSSLGVIFLLISGLAYGRRFVEILRITMWIAVTATFATYTVSLTVINWRYEPTYTPTSQPAPSPFTPPRILPRSVPPPDTYEPPTSNSGNQFAISSVWVIVVPIVLSVPLLLFLAKFIKKELSLRSRSTELASMPITSPTSD